MITKLAQKTVDALCGTQMIGEEDKDLYIYGFFILYSRLFFLVITVVFSSVLGIIWQGILMYIVFSLIRSYAGGVHASKESICLVVTTIALFVCVVVLKLCMQWDNIILSNIILVCEWICIMLLSPIDTAEKRLDPTERNRYKRFSCAITSVVSLAALFCAGLGQKIVLCICAISLGLESILLIIGYLRTRLIR